MDFLSHPNCCSPLWNDKLIFKNSIKIKYGQNKSRLYFHIFVLDFQLIIKFSVFQAFQCHYFLFIIKVYGTFSHLYTRYGSPALSDSFIKNVSVNHEKVPAVKMEFIMLKQTRVVVLTLGYSLVTTLFICMCIWSGGTYFHSRQGYKGILLMGLH